MTTLLELENQIRRDRGEEELDSFPDGGQSALSSFDSEEFDDKPTTLEQVAASDSDDWTQISENEAKQKPNGGVYYIRSAKWRHVSGVILAARAGNSRITLHEAYDRPQQLIGMDELDGRQSQDAAADIQQLLR